MTRHVLLALIAAFVLTVSGACRSGTAPAAPEAETPSAADASPSGDASGTSGTAAASDPDACVDLDAVLARVSPDMASQQLGERLAVNGTYQCDSRTPAGDPVLFRLGPLRGRLTYDEQARPTRLVLDELTAGGTVNDRLDLGWAYRPEGVDTGLLHQPVGALWGQRYGELIFSQLSYTGDAVTGQMATLGGGRSSFEGLEGGEPVWRILCDGSECVRTERDEGGEGWGQAQPAARPADPATAFHPLLLAALRATFETPPLDLAGAVDCPADVACSDPRHLVLGAPYEMGSEHAAGQWGPQCGLCDDGGNPIHTTWSRRHHPETAERTIVFEYNRHDLVARAVQYVGTTGVPAGCEEHTYDNEGCLTRVAWDEGCSGTTNEIVEVRTNAECRVTRVEHDRGADGVVERRLHFDSAGRLVGVDVYTEGGGGFDNRRTYRYDDVGCLIARVDENEDHGLTRRTYACDDQGNRTSDQTERPHGVSAPAGFVHTYDDGGNLTSTEFVRDDTVFRVCRFEPACPPPFASDPEFNCMSSQVCERLP